MGDKVYDQTKRRKCVFTGTKTTVKKRVVGKKFLSEDEISNWCNYAPSNEIYRNFREDKMPDELEMQANETFCQLELARLRVAFFEAKLEKIRNQILFNLNPVVVDKMVDYELQDPDYNKDPDKMPMPSFNRYIARRMEKAANRGDKAMDELPKAGKTANGIFIEEQKQHDEMLIEAMSDVPSGKAIYEMTPEELQKKTDEELEKKVKEETHKVWDAYGKRRALR